MSDGLRITLSEKDYSICKHALEGLSKIGQNKAVRRALSEGAKIIISKGKSNLSARNKKRKGNLKSSFSHETKSSWKKVYGGFRRPRGAASHLVDRGTKDRWTKKGAYRGKVQGSLFWTDAVNSEGGKAMQKLMETIIMEANNIVN